WWWSWDWGIFQRGTREPGPERCDPGVVPAINGYRGPGGVRASQNRASAEGNAAFRAARAKIAAARTKPNAHESGADSTRPIWTTWGRFVRAFPRIWQTQQGM